MKVNKALLISDNNIERIGELNFVASKFTQNTDALIFSDNKEKTINFGFDKIYGISGIPANNINTILEIAKQYDLIVTNGFIGSYIGGILAYKLKSCCVFGVTEIDYENFIFSHPIYGDKAIARYKPDCLPIVLTIKEKYFEQLEPSKDKTSSMEWIEGSKEEIVKIVKEEEIKKEVEIDKAKIVVGGGRGIGSKDGFEILKKIADAIGGTIGGSRAAVDNGWISSQYQIGQSGAILSATLYFAFGISGATQHLAGIKNVKCVVAINTDEEAPIFKRARFNIVADWKSFATALIKKLEELENG